MSAEGLEKEEPSSLSDSDTQRMDSAASTAASGLSLAVALESALPQQQPVLPDLANPPPHVSSGQAAAGGERACLWRPWLSSASDDNLTQAAGGATGAEVTKANSKFRHPVRLFWPKSRSFDYLYSDGELLLKNFPIQATINVYEDSDSEEEEEEEEEGKEKKWEAHGKGPEGYVRVPDSVPRKGTDYLPFSSFPC